MKTRLLKVLCTAAVLLCAGLLYAFLVSRMRLSVPCLFHTLTGLKCPGCGVSRMCSALLRGDFGEAFRQNRAVLSLLPFGIYVAAAWCAGYIRSGVRLLCGAPKAAAWTIVAVLIVFGIARNFLGW